MPSIPPNLSDERLQETIREMPVGSYRLEVSPITEAFLAPEGGFYFAIGDKVYVFWRVAE